MEARPPCFHGAQASRYKALELCFGDSTLFKSNFDLDDFKISKCEGSDGIRVLDSNDISI